MRRVFSITIFLLLICLLFSTAALAQQGQPRPVTADEVNAVAKQLYCPVCENVPLDVCPTQACAEWRELIRLKLSEGWNQKQIKAYFVEQYGVRVQSTTSPLIYIIPLIAIFAGAFIVSRVMIALRKPVNDPVAQAVSPPTATDEYANRLEEELRKRA